MAEVQAQLFGDLADTFAAINRDPAALQETIEETPPTLAAATASFRVQTPFLARFADVSRRLQPGRRRAAPRAAADQRRARRGRARLPQHARAGRRPRAAVRGARGRCRRTRTRCWRCKRPAPRAAGRRAGAPARRALPDGLQLPRLLLQPARHAPVGGRAGRHRRSASRPSSPTSASPTRSALTESKRPVDVPADQDPHDGPELQALHAQYGGPAIDSQGQRGLPDRADRLPEPARDRRALARRAPPGPNFKRRRQPRGPRRQHARPGRRHLQVAPARHRQPEGRAMSAFRAGVLTLVVLVVAGLLRLHQVEPVRQPLRAQGGRSRRPEPQAAARRCGSPGWRSARSPRSRREGDGEPAAR